MSQLAMSTMRVLRYIQAKGGATRIEIEALNFGSLSVKSLLSSLCTRKYLTADHHHKPTVYRLARDGAAALTPEAAAPTAEPDSELPTRLLHSDTLKAPTFAPSYRPGALDAFMLPSLNNGKRVPRKRPASICGAPRSLA